MNPLVKAAGLLLASFLTLSLIHRYSMAYAESAVASYDYPLLTSSRPKRNPDTQPPTPNVPPTDPPFITTPTATTTTAAAKKKDKRWWKRLLRASNPIRWLKAAFRVMGGKALKKKLRKMGVGKQKETVKKLVKRVEALEKNAANIPEAAPHPTPIPQAVPVVVGQEQEVPMVVERVEQGGGQAMGSAEYSAYNPGIQNAREREMQPMEHQQQHMQYQQPPPKEQIDRSGEPFDGL